MVISYHVPGASLGAIGIDVLVLKYGQINIKTQNESCQNSELKELRFSGINKTEPIEALFY
jgi:hypothetical protein